ncbi:hypothetical protein J0H58_15800 [bacterium]|nr:hypothetical protein [bacterium]
MTTRNVFPTAVRRNTTASTRGPGGRPWEGFADLKKVSKGATAAKAREILAKLTPRMTAD